MRRRAVCLTVTALVTAPVGGVVTQVVQARPAAASPSAGTIETLTNGANPQGALGSAAALDAPEDVGFDTANGLAAIADTFHNQVDVEPTVAGTYFGTAMAADRLYTLAGTGTAGFSGDGAPAAAAELAGPESVAFDNGNNLVVADSSNDRIRVIAATTGLQYGLHMIAGNIYTILGDGSFDDGGDNGPASAAHTIVPSAVRTDSAGDIIFTSLDAARVRVIAATTATHFHVAMTKGDVYTVAGDGGQSFSGDGGPAPSAALQEPWGASADAAGDLVIADSGNNRIRFVPKTSGTYFGIAMTAGDIYTVAGNGTAGFTRTPGPALSGELNFPSSVATDAAGDLVISDSTNNRVRVVAATTGTHYGISMTANDIYVGAGTGAAASTGDNGPATSATIDQPIGLSLDGSGNVLIADASGNRIRVVAPAAGTFFGIAMTANDIYGLVGSGSTSFNLSVQTVAVDAANNDVVIGDQSQILVLAQTTATYLGIPMVAGRLYLVAGTGTSGDTGDGGSALAAEVRNYVLRVLPNGSVVSSDAPDNVVRILPNKTATLFGQAMTVGDIYRLAGTGTGGYNGDGGLASAAELTFPWGVAADAAGDVFIADQGNARIRMIPVVSGTYFAQAMTANHIYTMAGNGSAGLGDDAALATSTGADAPFGVAVDSNGDVLYETLGLCVQMVAAKSGSFYGRYTSIGFDYQISDCFLGSGDDTGDGGPATSAELSSAIALAIDGHDNVAIVEANGNPPSAEKVRWLAASTGTYYGIPISAGDINTVAGDGTPGYSGDGLAATSAELNQPLDAAYDKAGDLLIADSDNGAVREVLTGGATAAAPSITATPKGGLVSGSAVTVKGKAFPASDSTLTVAECTADYTDVGLNACDASNQQSVTSTAKGAFTAVVTMATGVIAPDGSSCGTAGHTACFAVAFDTSNAAVTASLGIKFKP